MNLIKIICTGFLALVFSGLSAQENPLWMRYPAISPDGKTIAFCYKGDIFLVSSEGGRATQLTTHPAYDSRPIQAAKSPYVSLPTVKKSSIVPMSCPMQNTANSPVEGRCTRSVSMEDGRNNF